MSEIPGITDQQLSTLTDVVKNTQSFDFGNYSKASLKRRLSRILMLKKIGFDQLIQQIQAEPQFFQWFLEQVTVNVTEMFRDPEYYRALQEQVLPSLSAYPIIRAWSAGCSSGEEVYSLAILLERLAYGKKYFVYGTDINTEMLKEASKGVYTLRKLKSYEENYLQSGLPGKLLDHFTMMNDSAGVLPNLRNNTLFSVHNLVNDGVFNEFQLISCRNVFIYFESELQDQILEVFYDSLVPGGYLCLGTKETVRMPKMKNRFRVVNAKVNIYQKVF